MEKPKIMIINNPPSVVHISRNEPPLSPRPTLTSHNQKIVDGIPIKYVCTPCPECKAKLEVAEGLNKAGIMVEQTLGTLGPNAWFPIEVRLFLQAALTLWEKAGKVKP